MPISADVKPARASTRNKTMSASSMASSDCSAIFSSTPSSVPSIPPVSMTIKSCPARCAWPYLRSRVRPGKSATKASRVRVRRLNRVDLPTFGRPTKATTGVVIKTSYKWMCHGNIDIGTWKMAGIIADFGSDEKWQGKGRWMRVGENREVIVWAMCIRNIFCIKCGGILLFAHE